MRDILKGLVYLCKGYFKRILIYRDIYIYSKGLYCKRICILIKRDNNEIKILMVRNFKMGLVYLS